MGHIETISNCYKNNANVPANGSRVPANDSGLISKEPIPNIDDLELVEALARLSQMKQTSSVRAAEFCLRAEIASRGDRS